MNRKGCVAHDQITWADGTAAVGGPEPGGYVYYFGLKIQRVLSDPRTDWGWNWFVPCNPRRSMAFLGLVHMGRAPNPCVTGTAACRAGVSIPGFLAAARGAVPVERIVVDPVTVGVVNVRVLAALDPIPIPKSVEVRVTVPDQGDLDLGERLHVIWVVTATPEPWEWQWPDRSQSAEGRWVPQQDEQGGHVNVDLQYLVTAAGYWSDGITIHDLPGFVVGTISVPTTRAYDVQQVQPATL